MAGINLFEDNSTMKKSNKKQTKKTMNLFDEVELPKATPAPKKPIPKPLTPVKKAEPKKSLIDNVGDFFGGIGNGIKDGAKSIFIDTPKNIVKEINNDMSAETKDLKKLKGTKNTKEYADNFMNVIKGQANRAEKQRTAVASNVLDTATLGLGTKALDVVTGGKQTKALEESKKNLPGLSNAAGLAGYGAPFKAAGKIVAPLTKSLTNKAVKVGVKGFSEGAIVGGGESVSRQLIDKGKVDVKEAGKNALMFGGLGAAGELGIAKVTGKLKPNTQASTSVVNNNRPTTFTEPRNSITEPRNLLADEGKEAVSKMRTNTFQRSTELADEIAGNVIPEGEFKYNKQTVEQWQSGADKAVNENMQGVIDKIKNNPSISGGQEAHEAALVTVKLRDEAQATGNYTKLIGWLKTVSSKTRETARALKGTDTAWEKTSADGAILKAAKAVDKVEEAVKKTNPNKIKAINEETKAVTDAVDKASGESAGQAIKEILPEKLLARKVSGTLKQSSRKTNPITDMVNELFRSAKESPLPERVASAQRNPVEYLKQAIQNKGAYTDVWEKAKALLKEKYADSPESLSMLEDYFDKGIVPTYSEKTLNSSVQKSMKTLSQDLANIAKSTKVDKAKSLQDLTEYLVRETGATAEEATMLASKIQERFNALVSEKSDSILKQMFKNVPPKQQKTMFEKVQELINLGAYDKEAIRDLIKQKEGLPVLNGDDVKFITENMEKAKTLPEGSYEQRATYAAVGKLIANKVPSTGIEKFQAAQRISMLLNPKSLIVRNPLGNALLNTLEDVKNVPASVIDKGVSALRGSERTTVLAPISKTKASVQGAQRGINEWAKDLKNKVDTSPAGGGVELPNKTKIFNEESGNVVSKNIAKSANKVHYVIGKALKIGDTPFYNAAYDKRIAELKIINKTNTVTDAMKEDAHMFGLERTLQNDSELANLFVKGKKLSNNPAYQVVANLILPFAKTPANILDKFIDYSPAGAIKALGHTALTAGKGTFNQKRFVDLMGRSLTGTGLATAGYLMAQKGMITGARDKNSKVEAFETATGKSNYAFKVGNDYYTVDWALPAAAPLMMGADIYKAIKESKNPTAALTNGLSSGVNLMFNSTLLQGPSRLMGGYNPAASIAKGLMGTTTQATPTLGKQFAQLVDPIVRETYSPDLIKSMVNKTIARIPFASKTLPAKIDVTGKEIKALDGNNSLFNVLLNPGFKTTEKSSPGIKLIYKVYNSTGEEGVLPKLADKSITYKNKTIQLTPQQFTKYQKLLGKVDMKIADSFAENKSFLALSDEDKAKALKSAFEKYNSAIKLKMLMDISKESKK